MFATISDNNTMFAEILDVDAQLLQGGSKNGHGQFFKLTIDSCGIKVCYDLGSVSGNFKIRNAR